MEKRELTNSDVAELVLCFTAMVLTVVYPLYSEELNSIYVGIKEFVLERIESLNLPSWNYLEQQLS